jgi:hypothetical protein
MPKGAIRVRNLDGGILFFSGLAMSAVGIFALGRAYTIAGAVFALIGIAVAAFRRIRG